MHASFRVLGAFLVAVAIAPPARGQTNEPAKDPAAKPSAGDADLRSKVETLDLTADQLLTVQLANSLVSSSDLGIDVSEIQPSLRAQLNLAEGTGLVINRVPDDSPGAQAGFKAHDVLVKVGDDSVGTTEQLAEALKKADGKAVTALVIRQGKTLTLKATPKRAQVAEILLSDVPLQAWFRTTEIAQEERYRIGVVLAEADDTLRAQLGLAAVEGLIVTEVFPDTPAAKMGLQTHDVLTILDGRRLTTVDAINAQIQEIKDREVELKLLRSGKEVSLNIAPAKETFAAAFADFDRQGLTFWHARGCPGQVKTHDCSKCHSDPFPGWKIEVRGHEYYQPLELKWSAKLPAAAGSAQQRLSELKEQLAKMQQTLVQLEAVIQSAGEKKTEADDGKKDAKGKK